MCLDSTNKL